ncbi:Hydroxymethylpyrimidine ABC transporter, ATPase component [Lachnospiraceae bacterium TWA4]|nr:Hydroxymethylpyrimidine ABC transporter, ATPase component [Lachnospiraceae bacterium TWA4]
MQSILKFSNVSFSYHTLQKETLAVSNLNFEISPNEFTVIVGPSGCGKSTLLSLACGLLEPEEGKVELFGEEVKKGDKRIGYMLQKDHLFQWRTIEKNVSLGLEIHHRINEESISEIHHRLKDYHLSEFSKVKPSELSGGMRQRAALIRTLALEPELLLLDEPFSALDYQTRLEVGSDIVTRIKESKKTALMVTHDLSEAVSIADRVLVISKCPARLQADILLDFDKNLTPLQRRSDKKFIGYFDRLWKEIRNNDSES